MNQPKFPDDNQASLHEPGIRQEADNSTFGSGQQAAIGNDNIQIQGDNNWLGNTLNVFFGQQLVPVGNSQREHNQRLLLAQAKQEVASRLKQSLHNAVLINLGKESQPQQVKRPWDAEIKIGLKPAEPLPNTTTIFEVFDSKEIAGKLLILGAPGSGKTTTQLELAQVLIRRAEEQPDYPVPVLLNLSTWKDDRQSITDWLVAELKSKYGVSKKLGQEWVNNHQLLPLLDGLDELEPQRQELCVHAINQLLAGETRPLSLVICSRIEEYSNYATQLQLNVAIFLQPLTNNQICDYLTSINYVELWSTISNDLDLLELVKTPLLLSITVLTSQEISVEEWQNQTPGESRLKYLLSAYILRMLARQIKTNTYINEKFPTDKQTQIWLRWLAQQLQREFKTEFLIEEINPFWLPLDRQKKIFFLAIQIIIKLIIGLTTGAVITQINGLLNGLIWGTIIGITSNQSILPISPISNLKWSWLKSKNKLFKLLLDWLKTSIIIITLCVFLKKTDKLIITLISTLLFVLIAGLCVGFYAPDVEEKKFPNQGIKKSAMYAIIFGVMGGTIFGFFLGLGSGLINGFGFGLKLGLGVVLTAGLILGLYFGGQVCIQHFILRLILYRNGYIPWNYARFLDYCTERLFLQRVGGRYRFIHKLLQDHFAQIEFKRN
ncbi:NACHT domain-containing protein [Nostocales cyanobacterium LEGE 11386]|nr:NACHT domain-containing protein [Nostocales cyanobacterium LEGE 11386]